MAELKACQENGLLSATKQWGSFTITTTGTITLPLAYTNTNYKVVGIMESGKKTSVHGLDIHDKTTTAFKATPCTYYGGNNSTSTLGYAYIAVGY